MTGPFSGVSRELGREMELGLNTYFRTVNHQGGVAGRKIKLVPLDDKYEPALALANMKKLHDERKVFAVIGNIGTPAATLTVPYAVRNKILFFGAFSGANALRMIRPTAMSSTIAPAMIRRPRRRAVTCSTFAR